MSTAVRTVDVSAIINGRRLTAFNYGLIVLSWFITVFDGFDMMMIGFTAPFMRDEFGLSKMMLGRVFSAGLVGMMLGGFCFSFIADRIGRRPTVVIAAFSFGLLTMATAFAGSYQALLALRFLDGLAIGGMLPLAWALNIEFVPQRMRATVVSLVMLGYSMGTAGAAPITNILAPEFGWRGVYFAGGIGTLACATLLFLFLPESIRFLGAKGQRPDLIARILNRMSPELKAQGSDTFVVADESLQRTNFNPAQLFSGWLKWLTILLWVGYTLSSLAIYFDANWGPTVIEEIGFPRAEAGNLIGLSTILGAGLGLCLMRFTDRFGPFTVAIYPLLAIPVLLYIGLGHPSGDALRILLVVGPTLISGGHFGILSIAGVFYPSVIRANGAGWATSIAKIGAIAGPAVAGVLLAEGIMPIYLFALVAICPMILAVCAIGIGLVVRRERSRPSSALGLAEPAAAE
jgi:AAHS family 4-hydroxybenzoate transporter-like MFS transporter